MPHDANMQIVIAKATESQNGINLQYRVTCEGVKVSWHHWEHLGWVIASVLLSKRFAYCVIIIIIQDLACMHTDMCSISRTPSLSI